MDVASAGIRRWPLPTKLVFLPSRQHLREVAALPGGWGRVERRGLVLIRVIKPCRAQAEPVTVEVGVHGLSGLGSVK